MKGSKRDSIELDRIVSYLHGRIEKELEVWAERFSINPLELIQKLGTIFVGAQDDHLSGLRPASRTERDVVAEVEVVERAHGRRSPGRQRRDSKTTESKVVTSTWPKSKKARFEESLRRLKKRKDPTAKRIIAGMLRKQKGLPPKYSKNRPLQPLYAERHKARKEGKPLPPLPGEQKAAA